MPTIATALSVRRGSGNGSDGAARLIDFSAGHGIERFFVWLSPGPTWTSAELLDQAAFRAFTGRVIRHCAANARRPCLSRTDLRIRQVGPDDIGRQPRKPWVRRCGRNLRRRQAGRIFPLHGVDGSRPVAIAALCMFEDIGLSDGRGDGRERPPARRRSKR